MYNLKKDAFKLYLYLVKFFVNTCNSKSIKAICWHFRDLQQILNFDSGCFEEVNGSSECQWRMARSLELTLDSLTWIIRIIFPCPPEKSMRLPRRCIIHVAVSDGSKINRPDRMLSNRAFTVLSSSISLSPSSSASSLPTLPLFLLPLRYFGSLKEIDKLYPPEGF